MGNKPMGNKLQAQYTGPFISMFHWNIPDSQDTISVRQL